MKRKIAIFMTMVMALVTCFSICPSTANAAEDSPIVETYTCTVDGVKRTLSINSDNQAYFTVGESDPFYVAPKQLGIRFDAYGTVWCVMSTHEICWWNYDLRGDTCVFDTISRTNSSGITETVEDAASLVLDDEGFVIGYTTLSGETYPTLTLDEIKSTLPSEDDEPTSTPTVTPTTPPSETKKPAVTPFPSPVAPQVTQSPTPVVTPEPTVSPEETPVPSNSTKLSLKKKSGYTCLYTGNTLTAKYKLTKKGILTWKSGRKTKKIKGVKSAGFIKKSKNLIYMTKKGKVFTISSKGKKKTIVKKGAKKLVVKNKYVTKVKTKSGSVNVTKK